MQQMLLSFFQDETLLDVFRLPLKEFRAIVGRLSLTCLRFGP